MLVLVTAGTAALAYMVPIGLAIAALLAIVVTSYRQTVRAYPRGGGSYIVAKENLGTIPGLTAAAAILIDYVMTVAVSITAGTVAITSVAPETLGHLRVPIAVVLVLFVMAANLRGVKEAGTVFAVPTYGFVRDDRGHARRGVRRVRERVPGRRHGVARGPGARAAVAVPRPASVLVRVDRTHRRGGDRGRRARRSGDPRPRTPPRRWP